jgi:predicted phage terminase large subunit-like protein
MEEIDTWEIVSYPAIAEYDEYQAPNGRNYFMDPDSGTQVVPDSIFVPPNILAEEQPKIEDCKLLRKVGEALHPARYPLSQLRRRKNAMQPRHWHALYQQNPVPDEGNYFKKDHMRYHTGPFLVGDNPIGIAWDLAVGKKQVNDYTVGAVGMLNYNGDLQIIDLIRGRWDTHEAAAKIIETYKKYRSMTTSMCMVGIERGQLELAIRPELNRLSKKKGIYPPYDTELKPLTDKLIRARPLQGMMQGGSVVFADPNDNPWVEVMVHEMLRFPNGTFDDCVDALAWLVRMIERNFTRPTAPGDRALKRERRAGKLLTVKERLRDELRKSNTGTDPMAA